VQSGLVGIAFIGDDLVLGTVQSYGPTTGVITKYSGFSNVPKESFAVPQPVQGIAWDGTDLYSANGQDIVKHVGFSSTNSLFINLNPPYTDS